MMKICIFHAYYSNGGYFVYVREAGIRHVFDVYSILKFDNLPTKKEILVKAEEEIMKDKKEALFTKMFRMTLQ